jgi:hypothetical protein
MLEIGGAENPDRSRTSMPESAKTRFSRILNNTSSGIKFSYVDSFLSGVFDPRSSTSCACCATGLAQDAGDDH